MKSSRISTQGPARDANGTRSRCLEYKTSHERGNRVTNTPAGVQRRGQSERQPAYAHAHHCRRREDDRRTGAGPLAGRPSVKDVFGIPGGAILPVYDAIDEHTKFRFVLMRHEQAAGHAAEGYAVATGEVGVCIVTSGPGATNVITAIADANMDSIPMIVITGQVGVNAIGTDALGGRHRGCHLPGRQAFLPYHRRAGHSARALRGALHRAFRSSRTGGRGSDEDRPERHHVLQLAAAHDSARLQPDHRGAWPRARRCRQAVPARVPPGALRGRRRGAFRRRCRGEGALRSDRCPDCHHIAGAWHCAG